jgi:SAM-dependent methyltransferase
VSGRLHEAAAGGFGSAADAYERARPDYPVEALDRLTEELELIRTCRVMDLGAGTGKLTRMLVGTGAQVVAVEPVGPMRDRLAATLPRVPLVGGMAESLPFTEEVFDAVVCAQAFHWFDGERALHEIHRVLKRWGRLGLLWNIRDESVAWARSLGEILQPYQRAVPNEATGEWRRAFSATGLFGKLHQRRFAHSQSLDADGLVTRYASASYIAVLPEEERAEVLERIRRLAETHPDLAGRERFDLPYITELYWCARA